LADAIQATTHERANLLFDKIRHSIPHPFRDIGNDHAVLGLQCLVARHNLEERWKIKMSYLLVLEKRLYKSKELRQDQDTKSICLHILK
tara:strand:- start:1648 stop:1914 length:267 start_codon:yes stop_codon:yes gene_type:complete